MYFKKDSETLPSSGTNIAKIIKVDSHLFLASPCQAKGFKSNIIIKHPPMEITYKKSLLTAENKSTAIFTITIKKVKTRSKNLPRAL